MLDWGREISGDLAVAERREWLTTNGLGGYASGTVAGVHTRSYHGMLVAALSPPRRRTLLVSRIDDSVTYGGDTWPLFTSRWADGTISPHGYRHIERFRLRGTTPVWTFACADALVEKSIWMEPGADTTYCRYRVLRARSAVTLDLKVLVNYRDHHAVTRGDDWPMRVEAMPDGLRVAPFAGAHPFTVRGDGVDIDHQHVWYRGVQLAREAERGLSAHDDVLFVGTLTKTVPPGHSLAVVMSAEAEASLDGERAWERRARHERALLERWRQARPAAASAPPWVGQLVLAADQFVVGAATRERNGSRRRSGPRPDAGIIAGYHWFDEWGRDTMISLPGLLLTTGRDELAEPILTRFASLQRDGLLPNWFPSRTPEGSPSDAPEYNTADATLWYVEALRATHAATRDDGLLEKLFPGVEEILGRYRDGTRYGIAMDPADGLITAGAAGVQLTWMDAKVGDWIVTPRRGKAVEINALWYNAVCAAAAFARRLGRPAGPWRSLAARVRAGFDRFWNETAGYCYDVLDGPDGTDAALRPNQILAVSLPESALSPERQRQVVQTCARHLVTSYGLRSLAPHDRDYRGRSSGAREERDGAYHRGTVWAWLLGPFALAHFRVYGDPAAALTFLAPIAGHIEDYGVGQVAEIFDGDPPFRPAGCIAQAWSVGETLRAWHELVGARSRSRTR